MIVVDASVVIEALLRRPGSELAINRLFETNETLHAPHLLDLEATQVLRRYVSSGRLTVDRGEEAVRDLQAFPFFRHSHDALLPRVWGLRNNLTAYDAAYVALAEALDATLLTRDGRLAAAPGHRARIELI